MRFKLKIVLHGKSLHIRLKEHGSGGMWSEVNYDSTRFDMQSDADLIEASIYELDALQARYRFLIKQARRQQGGVVCQQD